MAPAPCLSGLLLADGSNGEARGKHRGQVLQGVNDQVYSRDVGDGDKEKGSEQQVPLLSTYSPSYFSGETKSSS